MKRMKAGWMAACAVTLLAGCDWEGTSEEDSISQRYNWVSFNGVYRSATNGYLVAEFGAGMVEPGETNQVTSQTVGNATAGVSAYNGVFGKANILPGTVQFATGVFTLTDNGAGVLAGGGKTGTIVYETGAWSIDLLGEWPPGGSPIRATYQYANLADTNFADPGSSGTPIFSLTLHQSGNALTMSDNNGATYSGKISSIKATGGASGDEPSTGAPTVPNGDIVTASYEVEGRSSSGMNVKIVGTLVGTAVTVAASTTTAGSSRLTNLELHGTWIEASGRTGDIFGVAP